MEQEALRLAGFRATLLEPANLQSPILEMSKIAPHHRTATRRCQALVEQHGELVHYPADRIDAAESRS